MVADSALYSESNLKLMSKMKSISRVPMTIKKTKNLMKLFTSTELKPSEIRGYSYQQSKVSYGGIEQRWLLVESAERKKADFKKIIQKIPEEFLKVSKQLVKLAKDEFTQPSLAEIKIPELATQLKYHQISDLKITSKFQKEQTVVYQISAKLRENQEFLRVLIQYCLV